MSYKRVPSPTFQENTFSPLPNSTDTLNDASTFILDPHYTLDSQKNSSPLLDPPPSSSMAHRQRTHRVSFANPKRTEGLSGTIPLGSLNGIQPLNNSNDEALLPTSSSSALNSSVNSSNLLFNSSLPPIRRLYLLLEDPSSSRQAFYFSIFIGFMIILSCFVATIETIPSLYTNYENLWFFREVLEISIILVFTLEYSLRVIAHSESWQSTWKFILSPLGILDLLSILPYYIEFMLFASSTRDQAHMSYVFRTTILKTFRLFRLFRVFKHSSLVQLSIEVLIVALKQSMDALSALFLFIVISLVVFSTLLYFAERGTWDPEHKSFLIDGQPSQFDSIPSSFWFVMVTLTTVGYGDLVPKTFIGKLISFPAMLCGILLIALPSIIVGRNFSLAWEHMRSQKTRHSGASPHLRRISANFSTPSNFYPPTSYFPHSTTTSLPSLSSSSSSSSDFPSSLPSSSQFPQDPDTLFLYCKNLAHQLQLQHQLFHEAMDLLFQLDPQRNAPTGSHSSSSSSNGTTHPGPPHTNGTTTTTTIPQHSAPFDLN